MKLCKDCRWSWIRKSEFSNETIETHCLHPVVNADQTGYMIEADPKRAQECWYARRDDWSAWRPWVLRRERCGTAARYWEAKE